MTISCITEMDFKGTLSYLHHSESTIDVDTGLSVKISRINEEVARVYFVSTSQADCPIPATYTFQNLTTGHYVVPFRNEWLISWTSRYELKCGDVTVLNIDYQREQAIRSKKRVTETMHAEDSGAGVRVCE